MWTPKRDLHMQLRIHAVVQRQNEKLMPKLGSPEDHQLSGSYRSATLTSPAHNLEIILWSQFPLNREELETAKRWVISNLGFV
jgi:hypothetical protein